MPNKKKRRGRRRVPLAATIGMLTPFTTGSNWSGGASAMQRIQEGNLQDALKLVQMHTIGVDPYNGKLLLHEAVGLKGAIVGGLISMLVGKLGINRYARVPLVKI